MHKKKRCRSFLKKGIQHSGIGGMDLPYIFTQSSWYLCTGISKWFVCYLLKMVSHFSGKIDKHVQELALQYFLVYSNNEIHENIYQSFVTFLWS